MHTSGRCTQFLLFGNRRHVRRQLLLAEVIGLILLGVTGHAQTVNVSRGASIQHAIDVAPEGAVIIVAPGVYREVLSITKVGITLRGVDSNATRTVIVFDKSAGTAGGTMKSAT